MITHLIIQPVRDDGAIQYDAARLVKVKEPSVADCSDFYLRIDGIDGRIKILGKTDLCKLCEGTGGRRYHYAQDHSVTVNCPICNGGDQKEWDKEKADWDRHTS